MRSPQDQVSGVCQHRGLGLRRAPPKHIDNGSLLRIYSLEDGVCKLLPAVSPVGIGLVRPHSQNRIQKEHSLSGPLDQIAVIRNITAQVVMKFPVNIYKRRGCRTAGTD